MAVHEVTFPITDPQEILKLRAGDEVVVQGHIIGIRDRTQIRIFDEGVEPPMDLSGAFLLHTAPGVRKLGPGRYEKVCIGTTTSARMVRFTEGLGSKYGVRAICGKGGLPDEAIEPMQRLGMVYLRSSAARLRSRRPRSRRSRRLPGRSSCPSASGSSASGTSARSQWGSTVTAIRSSTTSR